MSNNGIDYPTMEAARPAVKNWSVMEEVVSLLLILELIAQRSTYTALRLASGTR